MSTSAYTCLHFCDPTVIISQAFALISMRYRVTFMERTDAAGEPTEAPTEYVAIDVPDSVVCEKVFVERTPPDALHSEENLEEDDNFLSIGSRRGTTTSPRAGRMSFS